MVDLLWTFVLLVLWWGGLWLIWQGLTAIVRRVWSSRIAASQCIGRLFP